MDNILEECEAKVKGQFSPYEVLNREMLEISKSLLAEKLPKTREVIGDMLSAQLGYINVMNEQFEDCKQKIAIEQANQQSDEAHSSMGLLNSLVNFSLGKSITAKENAQCQDVKQHVKAYFDVVRNQMKDLVVKIVACFLVYSFINELHEELINRLHSESRFDELFTESTDKSLKRKMIADRLETLEMAQKVISKVNKGN